MINRSRSIGISILRGLLHDRVDSCVDVRTGMRMVVIANENTSRAQSDEPGPIDTCMNAGRIDLPITGMTCAACANRIERQLTRAPGVRSAGVNLATNRATVEFDP